MKNLIVLLAFLSVFILSLIKEPINDVIDAVAGVTNPTYSTSLDATAGASLSHEDDDDEEEDDD
ncbi:MAG: hypothetical protein KJ847_04010 [Firmicutes bacterium]|nr:hypothetical protein [Bacillota bacterium]